MTTPVEGNRRSTPRKGLWIAIATLGVALAIVAWLFSFLAAGFSCYEAGDCATGRGKYEEYRGRLFDGQGRPLGRMNLKFSSDLFGPEIRSGVYYRRRTFDVPTDDLARFCVRTFASKNTSPSIDPPLTGDPRDPRAVLPAAVGPVDPRFQDLARLDAIGIERPPLPDGSPYGVMEPSGPPGGIVRPDGTIYRFPSKIGLEAGYEVPELWDPALDKAAGCHDLGVELHWYDFEDNFTSWQFILLMLAPLLTVLLYLAVLTAWFRARRRPLETARVIRRSQQTAAMSAITLGLTVLLWYVLI